MIDAFNSTSRYLGDLLNIDNIHFEHMVHRIYPAELQLNKANASDTEAAFLDLNLSIHNDIVSTKIYDKRDDFNFDIPWWWCPSTSLLWCIYKLTRNKNARHIFPHHFCHVAMIGIMCLYMHFALYTLHTRSIFFKYLYYFLSYDRHCTKCTCTSCGPTTRPFDTKINFDIASLIYWTNVIRNKGLVVLFQMLSPILKSKNSILGRLAAHFHRFRYIDVTTYLNQPYQCWWNILTLLELFQTINVLVHHMWDAYVRFVWYVNVTYVTDSWRPKVGQLFAIVNPQWPKWHDKVTNLLRVCGMQCRPTSNSYLTVKDVCNHIKCNLWRNLWFWLCNSFLWCLFLSHVQFWMAIQKLFSKFYWYKLTILVAFLFRVSLFQLIRFARASSHVTDFNNRNKFLTVKLLRQGYRYHKLRKAFPKFYRKHFELIEKYHVSLKKLMQQGICNPEFYGDLVYKFKKISGNPNFSNLFKRKVNRFKRAGYF